MLVHKPIIPFRRLYTKQWDIASPLAVLEKMQYIVRTGKMPSGLEYQDVLITILDGRFFVREGTHRIVAMIMLGYKEILPQEYRLVVDEEHLDHVRRKMSEYPEMTSPRTISALTAMFRHKVVEVSKNWNLQD